MVTKKTFNTHAWAQKRDNLKMDQTQVFIPVHAVILAVSREYGVDLVQVYEKSINKRKFRMFLDALRRKYFYDNILLVMDNLSLHKSNDMK